ncbi:hypothetical protein [Ferroacidibacillus organovorans]|uniref:hypothetical protein n=1 Tax=Ferroacidibacillus organovorans TaxID=1765683 RepID=UPI00082ED7E4|nr:hypothetical protein [Ferroacidibacillus organovorans]
MSLPFYMTRTASAQMKPQHIFLARRRTYAAVAVVATSRIRMYPWNFLGVFYHFSNRPSHVFT